VKVFMIFLQIVAMGGCCVWLLYKVFSWLYWKQWNLMVILCPTDRLHGLYVHKSLIS
jgi:hypothetical protein